MLKSISTFSPGLKAGRPIGELELNIILAHDLPRYGQLAHRNASPKKQLPQLLVAFGADFAAWIKRSFSLCSTTLASPFWDPSKRTTFPVLRSSSSSSARPHVHPLQAFFRRGAPPVTGSQVGAGRDLSSAVRSASASINGVAGADVIAHSAFFFSGSVLRFSLNNGAGPFLDRWFGFCAIIVPSLGRDETIVKPAKVSSEGRDWNPDARFSRRRFPNGIKLS